MTTIGFCNSISDNSLFVYCHGSDTAYLLLYVDDIILTASSDVVRQSIMSKLSFEFTMKDLGPLNYFSSSTVTCTPTGLFLSQQKYALEILDKADMSQCKPCLDKADMSQCKPCLNADMSLSTPVTISGKLCANASSPCDDPTLYRSLANALQYLTFTRPDISYDVQQVCLHMHDSRVEHMGAIHRILRYIQRTPNHGLHLYKSPISHFLSYTDADWGSCPNARWSTSSYCVFFGDNLISWSAKRQPAVSKYSVEAEYRGVVNAVSKTCWIRNLLLELYCFIPSATLVYCDNVSVFYLAGNPVHHQRAKHIEIDIHFVWEKVRRGDVRVLHVPTRY